ncbi:MAG: molybdate ABC transporter substrate-binding protein [Sphingobium sp.]
MAGRSGYWRAIVALFACLVLAACGDAPKGPVVLAAASLQPALEEAGRAWQAQGHEVPTFSFAASSALARQIEAGAPADLFLSADEDWADYLEKRNLTQAGSRVTLLANALVLVAPKGAEPMPDRPGSPALLRWLGQGRLAVADPDAVPAGKYAKAALRSRGLWDSVSNRLAPAENVRAALVMVERGQAPAGIVYATDAKGSAKVEVVERFPATSHPPIRYPMVTIRGSSNPEAAAFRSYLMSPAARAIFARYGFEAQ